MGLHPDNSLTKRQEEIVALLATGISNKAIAEKLGISTQVVKNYIRSIYDKLGCDNRLQCALWYLDRYDDRDKQIESLQQLVKQQELELTKWRRRLG